MNIFHELPLMFLDNNESYKITDGDYCLPHLLDKYENYKSYFLKSRKNGRYIIMDNGLFEDVIHTEQDLLDKINLINPNIFITPDEWNNSSTTFKNAKYWMNVHKNNLPYLTNLMVVLQGTSYTEIETLYNNCVDLGFTHFAINHSSIIYRNIFPHSNYLVSQMMGRILLINKLINSKSIKDNHYIHLLGCSLPQEFQYYSDPVYNCIKSLDTSNPIIKGFKKEWYSPYGTFDKPSEKIEKFIEIYDESIKNIILYNIKMFRKYIYNKPKEIINV